MSLLRVGPAGFSPRLIIFDKDGTLIDFHAMWATWAVEFARQLELVSQRRIADQLFHAMGFDAVTRHVIAGGALALWPMAEMYDLSVSVLRDAGLSQEAAQAAVAQSWFVPDPVAWAQPLADLGCIFATLRERGAQIAIATSDDRAATEATLIGLGLTEFVSAIVCADDRLPIKPAADMLLHLCRMLDVSPAQTVMVGDSIADMAMGRAAAVGLVVGVLSGVSSAEILAPHADVLVSSVAALVDCDS